MVGPASDPRSAGRAGRIGCGPSWRSASRHHGAIVILLALPLLLGGCSGPGDTRTGSNRSSERPVDPAPTAAAAPADPRPASDGSIYFAAQGGAGPALTDPVGFGQAERHPRPTDIYLSRPGQPVRRIIATSAAERCPRVSPDGDRLAYLEDAAIVVVPLDADGDPGAPTLRVKLPQPPSCPQWSPDGRRLGYLVVTGDPDTPLYETRPAEVHAVGLDGQDRVLVSFETQIWHQPQFAWSPKGDELVYTTEGGVWRAPVDGGTSELVWRPAEGDPAQELPMVFDRPVSITWARPREIMFTLFASTPDEADDPYGTGTETRTVEVIHLGSGRVQSLQELPPTSSGAASSPDGSQLAFVGGAGQLRVYDRATGATSRLAPRLASGDGLTFTEVGWSPDGSGLLGMARTSASGYSLVSVPVDGSPSEVRTPWTWALDWVGLEDVDWSSR
jgi:Tol biopolymer transport system component